MVTSFPLLEVLGFWQIAEGRGGIVEGLGDLFDNFLGNTDDSDDPDNERPND